MIEPSPQSSPDPVNPTSSAPANPTSVPYVALTGNPNSGKTTLFNRLTGLRAKVGNYAGVTVERKEGRLKHGPSDREIRILDLPGTYSLSPNSMDEQVSRDVLLGRLKEVPQPQLVVVVVDAANLQRNLYYATQVIELGYPTIIALNMTDVAEELGQVVDAAQLAQCLEAPVLPIVASTGRGVAELREKIVELITNPPVRQPRLFCQLPGLFRIEATGLAELLATTFQNRPRQATAEALLILSNENAMASSRTHYPPEIQSAVTAARQRLEAAKVDWRGAPIEWRYARVAEIQQAVTSELAPPGETFSDKADRIITHKIWGSLIFLALMFVIFQCIFTFADYPMRWLEGGMTWMGDQVGNVLPPGDLRDLLVNGVIAGVGSVVVFLPQILMLFTFIGLLEDTGYMARAAFLMDRLMSRVGLHGKSFIPMLSSFACAIPGIMATRTIESPKDRLVTILVAPLMSCSARLPIYTLLIGATIPDRVLGDLNYRLNLGFAQFNLFGFLGLRGLTMLAMYLLGIIVALLMAWVFKKTLLKSETPMLIMELPPYKRPLLRVVLQHIWDRSKLFLTRAGTVILGVSIVLWFLATYPKSDNLDAQFAAQRAAITNSFNAVTLATGPGSLANQNVAMEEQLAAVDQAAFGQSLRYSFAGRMGRAIEPILTPLGFDWKIGIGIISSFAAREVFVSTMSTVYNLSDAGDSDAGMKTLEQTLREQKRPDGQPVYTTLVAVTLMVFYVFALQCASTVAIVHRETNSWKWPAFQWAYMGVLAWTLAFITYQGGRLLGWG